MICNQCGKENAPDCIFCVYCGAKVESSTEQTLKVESSSYGSSGDLTMGPQGFSPPPEKEKIPDPPPVEEKIPPPTPAEEKSNPSSDFGKAWESSSHSKEEKKVHTNTDDYNQSSSQDYLGEVKTNVLSIVSMVISIVNLVACCGTIPLSIIPLLGYIMFPLQGIIGLVSMIMGFIGKKQISNSAGMQKGGGFAITGIIVGALGVLLFVIWLVLLFLGFATIIITTLLGSGQSSY